MDYKTKCGCIVVDSPPNFRIKYCPKHDAAPAMYEALKELSDYLYALGGNEKLIPPKVYQQIKVKYLKGYEVLTLADRKE